MNFIHAIMLLKSTAVSLIGAASPLLIHKKGERRGISVNRRGVHSFNSNTEEEDARPREEIPAY
jgi:hypothetical protein